MKKTNLVSLLLVVVIFLSINSIAQEIQPDQDVVKYIQQQIDPDVEYFIKWKKIEKHYNEFMRQVNNYRRAKFPKSVLDSLLTIRANVITKALSMNVDNQDMTFVLVVPENMVCLKKQLNIPSKYDNLSQYTDKKQTPKKPYVIWNVKRVTGVIPLKNTFHFFKEEDRRGLTLIETAALMIQDQIFKDYYHIGYVAFESLFKDEDCVHPPIIFGMEFNRFYVDAYLVGSNPKECIAPTCNK